MKRNTDRLDKEELNKQLPALTLEKTMSSQPESHYNPEEARRKAAKNPISVGSWTVEQFLDSEIELNPLGKIPQRDLYNAYEAYCVSILNESEPAKRRSFGQDLREYFEVKKKISLETYIAPTGTVFRGIQFRRKAGKEIIDTICQNLNSEDPGFETPQIASGIQELYALYVKRNKKRRQSSIGDEK